MNFLHGANKIYKTIRTLYESAVVILPFSDLKLVVKDTLHQAILIWNNHLYWSLPKEVRAIEGTDSLHHIVHRRQEDVGLGMAGTAAVVHHAYVLNAWWG